VANQVLELVKHDDDRALISKLSEEAKDGSPRGVVGRVEGSARPGGQLAQELLAVEVIGRIGGEKIEDTAPLPGMIQQIGLADTAAAVQEDQARPVTVRETSELLDFAFAIHKARARRFRHQAVPTSATASIIDVLSHYSVMMAQCYNTIV